MNLFQDTRSRNFVCAHYAASIYKMPEMTFNESEEFIEARTVVDAFDKSTLMEPLPTSGDIKTRIPSEFTQLDTHDVSAEPLSITAIRSKGIDMAERKHLASPNPSQWGPLLPAQPKATECHDTTIHRYIRPAVIHETIRPVEETIVATKVYVHRHVHHHVHRVQPVLCESEEEERMLYEMIEERPEGFPFQKAGIEVEDEREFIADEGNVRGNLCGVCRGASLHCREANAEKDSSETIRPNGVSGENCPACGEATIPSQEMRTMNISE
jgi:hypothetical protein